MSALITYSYIDNDKNIKISTHPIGSLSSFLKFVLANKQYIIWANLTDLVNGSVVEQYINIKNYQNNGLENTQLCLKGKGSDIYKRVYIIHKLEFQELVEFIKKTNEEFYCKLLETKAFKMLPFNRFINNDTAKQFYLFPADIYDITMGEFSHGLQLHELLDFEEKLPIARELFVDVKETEQV